MVHRLICLAIFLGIAPAQNPPVGYTDTPVLPGQKWRVHDIDRPRPRVVNPGAETGKPPSDAVVLFDGHDLSKWTSDKSVAPGWKVEKGYMEVVAGAGSLVSKEKFGSAQIHLEWATPVEIKGAIQGRGNSGVLIMSRYEIQVLDSYNNVTYADGQASAIYGQWPPLVNASRQPGAWQTYDIAFEAPQFEGQKLIKPAYVTVFHNGVLTHHHREIMGEVIHRDVAKYKPHDVAEPLMLQDHNAKVRYRNIWIRRL